MPRLGVVVALAFVLSPAVAGAQGLTLSVRPPLPNQLSLDDVWRLVAVNGSTGAVAIVFHARVTDPLRGLVFEARSGSIVLAAGSRTLDARQLAPIAILNAEAGISAQLNRIGAFPDGRYTVCVDAEPASGGASLATACVDQEVSSVLPPVLIGPYNGEPVTDPLILWTWFMQPASRTGERTVCDLQVAEILAHQTPEEALRVNPPILLRKGLESSAWQTNEAVRRLIPGQSYAWQVTARLGATVSSRSEIWTFVYAAPIDSTPDADSRPAAGEHDYVPGHVSPWAGVPVAGGAPSGAVAPAAVAPSAVARDSLVASAPDSLRTPPVTFSVRRLAMGEVANRPGALSSQPARFARLELDPTITIYGSPLTLNLLLASDEDSERPDITRGALGFEPRSHRGIIVHQQATGAPTPGPSGSAYALRADSLRRAGLSPEQINQQLDQLTTLPKSTPTATENELQGMTTSGETAYSKLPGLAFGNIAPDLSALMMSGVTMNGGLIEYRRPRSYETFTVGKVQREEVPAALAVAGRPAPQLYRNLYAARLGLGSKTGNHVALSTLYARDDEQSRSILGLADTIPGASAQDNWVMGVAGRAASHGGRMLVDGELNASLFNQDREGPAFGSIGSGGLNPLFGRRNVRDGSAVDWAGSLRSAWKGRGDRSHLAAGVRFVGPGYTSVGVRGLRTDLRSYDGAWDQSLASDRLAFGCRLSYERTGIVLPGRGNSLVTRVDTHTEWHPAHGPSIQLAYLHNRQEQGANPGLSPLQSDVDQADLRFRDAGSLGRVRTSSFLSIHIHHGTSADTSGRNTGRAVQLAEMLSLPAHLSVFLRATHTRTTTGITTDTDPRVTNLETTIVCDIPHGIENSVGATTTDGEKTTGRGLYLGSRLTFAHGGGAFEVRWEYDRFADAARPTNDRTERIASASLTLNP